MSESSIAELTFVEYCLGVLGSRGEKIAFSIDDRHLTGNESVSLVHSMAKVLQQRGIGHGDSVCALAGNLPEAYLLQVAVQLIGARHTGLHPYASADDHALILRETGAKALVFEPRGFTARAEAIGDQVRNLLSLGASSSGTDLLSAAEAVKGVKVAPVPTADDTSSIYFTGGTTGVPKGVVHTHRSSLAQAMLLQGTWQWPADLVFLAVAPITHAAGQMIAPALAHGARVILMDGFDPDSLLRTIESEKVSMTFLVPTMIYTLLDRPDIADRDVSSLKTLVYGASPIALDRLRQAREVFGEILMQGFGQTEVGSGALLLRREEHRLDSPAVLASAGRAPAGASACIMDEDGNQLPAGSPGELCLRAASIMTGYLNQPEQTAAAFKYGWLHTGDIGVMDADGFITIIDRKKDMIVSGGFNIYSKEVEDALHAHPGVRLAAVVGIPHPKWGEAVHAVVEIEPDAATSVEELMAWVKEKKGSVYAPKSIELVGAVPKTSLGKIDKKAIRARASANSSVARQ